MCELTRHSQKRLKERCGCNKSAQLKLANNAFDKGITHAQTSGSLKRYLDGLYLRERKANTIRIYGDKVFLFGGETLITVLRLPQKYRRACGRIIEKYEKNG